MPWITLNQTVRIRQGGVLKTYYKGDSVKVGKQQALTWVFDGTAADPFGQVERTVYAEAPEKFGLVILAPKRVVNLSLLGTLALEIDTTYEVKWSGTLPYTYNLVCQVTRRLSTNILNYGLGIISGKDWEMAASLVNLKHTLGSLGSKEDRDGTLKLYGDLRLPAYDTSVLWIKATKRTRIFSLIYSKLLLGKVNPSHAFARAWLRSKPLLYTMPLG